MSTQMKKLEEFFHENAGDPKLTEERKQELRKYCKLGFIEVITVRSREGNGPWGPPEKDLRVDTGAIHEWRNAQRGNNFLSLVCAPMKRGLLGLYISENQTPPPLPITQEEWEFIDAATNDEELARRILEVSNRPLKMGAA